MYIEITGPATRIERDYENDVSVKMEATLTQEVEIPEGNPNMDHYFDSEFLYDYRVITVNGEDWELDTGSATIERYTSVSDVIRSANNRADEDVTSLEHVLEKWSSYRNAPDEVRWAFNFIESNTDPSEMPEQ